MSKRVYLQLKLLFDAEFGQLDGNEFGLHLVEKVIEHVDAESVLDTVETHHSVLLLRDDDEHSQVFALVRNADHFAADGRAVDVGDFGVLEHGGNGERLQRRHVERLVARQFRRERIGPVAVEVDGVGDDQPRVRLQIGEDVGDLTGRLVRHPSVDGACGRTGAALEIHLGDFTQVEVSGLIKQSTPFIHSHSITLHGVDRGTCLLHFYSLLLKIFEQKTSGWQSG